MPQATAACAYCAYYHGNNTECRRYPPETEHVLQTDRTGTLVRQKRSYFPLTDSGWWCGEFYSRVAETAGYEDDGAGGAS